LEILLLIIGAGCLGYEMVYSDLAYTIKHLLFLHKEQLVVQLLTSFKAYKKIMGIPFTLLLAPLVFGAMILATVHRTTYKLLQCPFCTTFQSSFWTAYLVLQTPLVVAVSIAGCALMSAALYNLIRMKSI
jgi:hypothetical protein